MKFVKEFPWFDLSQEKDVNVSDLCKGACNRLKKWSEGVKEKAKEKYPVYKEKATCFAKRGFDYSKSKGKVFYKELQEKAPHYWEHSKEKFVSFLNKVKERYGRRK